MWSPQQGFSSWFLRNLQRDTLKRGRYQMVWKNFGKRLRMARGRTKGHGCTMSWLPSVANATFSPRHPHPMVHPSYFQGVNARQFFHHSDGKRQRTLKITLDTRQRHLKASQCHQALLRRLQELVLPSTLHTLQEKPLVLGAHSTSQSHCRAAPAAEGQCGCKRKFGEALPSHLGLLLLWPW